MKQKLLSVGTFAFALMASIPNAKADTTILSSDNGYQKITTMPESLSDYYFIIVDRDKDLMLSLQNGVNQGNKTMFYRTSVDPTEDLNKVWELEAFDGGYSIRNIDYDVLLLQTELNKAYHIRTNDQPVGISWAKWLFSYDTDSWTIENGVYPMSSTATYKGYVGSWNGGDINDGDEVAGNKLGDDIGHYCIYSIKKRDFHNLYVQKHKTQLPVSMTSFIFNEAFEANGQDSRGWGLGWQGTGTDKGKSFARQTSNQTNFSGAFAEMYGNLTENNLHQTIKGLPAGIYRLYAAVLNNTNANAQLYAKAGETELASLTVNGNPAQIRKLEFTITETTDVTIGFSVPGTSSTTWIAIDNFALEYVGADESEKLANDIRITKVTAENLYSSPMEKSVLDALKAKVAAAESASTVEDMRIGLENLNTAIVNANTSIAAYETLNTAIEKANEIVNNVYIYKEEDKTNYINAIAEAQSAYTNGTYTNAQATEMQNKLWNTDYKSELLLARPFISSIWSGGVYTNNWSLEADNKANGSGMVKPFIEYWTGDGNSLGANEIKAELSNMEAGSYNVTALVRVRIKNGSEDTPHGITMQANDASAVDVCNGKTCDDGAPFRYDVYSTVGEVKEDGTLAIAFNVMADNNISWLSFKEVKYVKVADVADYEKLSTAIATAESKNLGFAEGEYAPYNNVEAVAALNAAKSVDMAGINKESDILAIIDRLNAAEWTVNVEEVNAVYNGDFSRCENNGPMPGWQMSNNSLGGAYHSRAFVGDDRLTEFNETKSAAFLRFDGTNSDRGSMYTYGNAEGYTMPLKANTVYYLSVDVKGWGSKGKPIRLNLNGPDGFSAWSSQITTENQADTDDSTPQRFYYVFNTSEFAGNYKISFQVPGSDDNKHNIVVSNVELLTAKAEDITVNVPAEYGTMILPFDAEIPSDMEVYSVNSSSEQTADYAVLNLEKVEKIAANTPYIVKSDATEFIFNGVAFSEKNEYKNDNSWLTGVMTDTTAPKDSYVLQNQNGKLGFYKVETDDIIIPANRAYLIIPASEEPSKANVHAFVFDLGNVTGINNVEAADALVNVYSIDGVLVRKAVKVSEALNGLQKGIYVVNGAKKAVK